MRILFLMLLTYCSSVLAQAQPSKDANINQYNKQQQKDGVWYEYVAPLRGESGYHYFGKYAAGKRIGNWQKIDAEGRMISNEHFRNDILHGTAMYYENGNLVATGNWRGLNPQYPFDTIPVINIATGLEDTVIVPSEYGALEHGLWRYYSPVTGMLIKEVEYQVGTIIKQQEFYTLPIVDSAQIKKIDANLPHNKKSYYKPPAGRGSQIK